MAASLICFQDSRAGKGMHVVCTFPHAVQAASGSCDLDMQESGTAFASQVLEARAALIVLVTEG